MKGNLKLRWKATREYWPECKSQFSILHEWGISHIQRCTTTQRWSWQKNITVLQKKRKVVKHSLLILSWSSAEVAQESATCYHHLMRRILLSTIQRCADQVHKRILQNTQTITSDILLYFYSSSNMCHEDVSKKLFIFTEIWNTTLY